MERAYTIRRGPQFRLALENMKILAGGGMLPPAPPRGNRGRQWAVSSQWLPIAIERFERLADGRLMYRFKTDGRRRPLAKPVIVRPVGSSRCSACSSGLSSP
jgi:hypothetical protein